ncbi:unnamed protein product [Prunus brigantina]
MNRHFQIQKARIGYPIVSTLRPYQAFLRKLKLHFRIYAYVPKKGDSSRRRTSSLSRRESPQRDSKSPKGIIEICSQDSSADSSANASDYSVVPDSLRGSRSRSGDAKGGGKATMRSTPRARDVVRLVFLAAPITSTITCY